LPVEDRRDAPVTEPPTQDLRPDMGLRVGGMLGHPELRFEPLRRLIHPVKGEAIVLRTGGMEQAWRSCEKV
jgi:hypothetical protein